MILAGDYNINLLNLEIHSETGNFLNILFANAMVPTITRPTRYGEHCATLIDNILSNMVISCDSQHLSDIILEISDHLPVFFLTGEVKITKDPIFYKKNFREINEANLSDFQNRIESINWRAKNELGINLDYDNFHDKLSQIYNECFQFKEKIYNIYQNKYKPWLTPCILNSINKKTV